MPRHIIKLTRADQSWYLEWSTIVDAPLTYGMSREEFTDYYRDEYGRAAFEHTGPTGFAKRMARADANGTSAMTADRQTLDRLLDGNRAGDDESCLTKDQIIDRFCVGRPKDDD